MRIGPAARSSILLALCASLFAFAVEAEAKPKARPTARRATGAAYRAHVQRWHAKDDAARAPLDAQGRPKLVLENINTKERVELESLGDGGGFSEAERARATSVLRDTHRGGDRAADAELLDLLYRLQRHFDAPCVRVVSAYRAGGASQHARGRAADIVLPGVDDAKLAAYARSLGGTGVGLYPRSGFVHVDVRESPHYWVDWSGPGERSRPVKQKKPAKKVARKSPRPGAR